MSLKAICPVKASTKALKAGLQVGIQSAFRHIGSTANCTLNLPLRKHIFFAGNSKLKITRSVKTISLETKKRTLFAPSDGLLVSLGQVAPQSLPPSKKKKIIPILATYGIVFSL